MILSLLAINIFLLGMYMTGWFAWAQHRRRIDTVDIAWGPGFMLVAWVTWLFQPTLAGFIVACLVSVWGSRLAYHIWRRSQHKPDDPRYRALTTKWKDDYWWHAYRSIYLLQAVLIWLISLPIVLMSNPVLGDWEWLLPLGIVVWLVGFGIEAAADNQLRQYLTQPKRPKVMQTGLWKYSRHPNYFGELVQWWGIGIIALSVHFGWIGLLGPALLSFLIIKVSGIPPIEQRRAKDKAYREYQKRTSVLIPLPPRS